MFVELQGRETVPAAHDGGLINIYFSFIIVASSREKIQDASVLSTIIVAQDVIKSTIACYHKAESPLADTTPVGPFAGLYSSVAAPHREEKRKRWRRNEEDKENRQRRG